MSETGQAEKLWLSLGKWTAPQTPQTFDKNRFIRFDMFDFKDLLSPFKHGVIKSPHCCQAQLLYSVRPGDECPAEQSARSGMEHYWQQNAAEMICVHPRA